MLKTYRIIPLVFILFLFGFTLITVAPVFAQDPMLEERIRNIEEALCTTNGLRGNLNKTTGVYTLTPIGRVCEDIDSELESDRNTPTPSLGAQGNTTPPPPKKFFCAQFPEALNYQECMKKIKKAKECRRNPSMC